MVPLTLIALILLFPLPQISQSLYELINKINEFQWIYLEFLSKQNNAVIPIAAPNLWSLILAITGVLILIMPKGLPARWLGPVFFIPLLFPLTEKLEQGEFEFVLLDVGQGLAAVIQTKEHTLVYDTGARFSENFNIGDTVIKPYLRKKGVNQISTLLISHGDNDHIGGATAIIDNFRIDKVLSSVPISFVGQIPRGKLESCYAGQKWHWDGVDFEILHPHKNDVFAGNNASCVLKASSKQGSVLLTGDIEKEAEQSLIERYNHELHADILLVPHHGSRTSSTERFVSAVSAKYAFIPTGYRNRFGFPKEDIMSRYDDHAVKTFISYKTGEISAKFHDEGLQIDEFRTKNRRFWHH
jgi:competence protein ComEC